jgi:hypothetical protein
MLILLNFCLKKLKYLNFLDPANSFWYLLFLLLLKKTLSERTEVAGIIEYFTAILNNESRKD